MKFSLRTFLVTLCVVGAAAGVMGKLLVERPEAFLATIEVGSTVGPFVLAIATIVWIGWRRKDQRRLIWWGIFLLLFPFATRFGMALLWPSHNPLRLLSNRRLITLRLPAQVDQPWIWDELTYRLNSGSLSRAEVDEAVEQLIAYMKKTRPNGWKQPLSWQHGFLSTATKGKTISDDVYSRLCDAFFGSMPTIRPIPPLTAGRQTIDLFIEFGNPFDHNTGLGVVMLWDVKQVSLDGKRLKPRFTSPGNGWTWSNSFDVDLSPGEHKVEVQIEAGYVGEAMSSGATGATPVNKWPKTKTRWTTTVTAPVKVNGGK